MVKVLDLEKKRKRKTRYLVRDKIILIKELDYNKKF